MIKKITKKEMKRVQKLRQMSLSSAPKGLYFIAPDNQAYLCDTPGMKGAKEMAHFNKQIKDDLQAQESLL
jgi:hypothetical protein